MSYKKELDQLKLLTEQNAAEKQVFTQLNETYRRGGRAAVTCTKLLSMNIWLSTDG